MILFLAALLIAAGFLFFLFSNQFLTLNLDDRTLRLEKDELQTLPKRVEKSEDKQRQQMLDALKQFPVPDYGNKKEADINQELLNSLEQFEENSPQQNSQPTNDSRKIQQDMLKALESFEVR